MKENATRKIINSFLWTFGEKITAQFVSIFISVILARILEPEHYGTISIVTVFIMIGDVFVTNGFGKAVVQKADADELDYNTAFILSMATALILYALLFLLAPLISVFFELPILKTIVRVMALRIPLAAINTIQQAVIQHQMEFKKFFISTLFGTVISGVAGIVMALKGHGIWALVAQYLLNVTIDTCVLACVGNWRPRLQFHIKKAREIISFGWKLLIAGLVDVLERELSSMMIVKVFGSTNLAYYDQGNKYPKLIVNNLTTAVNKVMLPAFSRHKEDCEKIKQMLRKSVHTCIFLLAPMMIGFMAVANTFVSVILTEKWLMCVPFIQIFCLSYLTRPMESFCQQAILAIGRSDVILKIMIVINLTALGTLLAAVFILESVMAVAIGSLLTTLSSLTGYMIYSSLLLNYMLREQLQDIMPIICNSIIMGIMVWLLGRHMHSSIFTLIIQIFSGIGIYVLLSKITKIQAFNMFIINIRRKKLESKRT